jgi:carbonic anhydrase/acetyltransferase-like protein (isoleucine patch superfamily)
VFLCPQVGINHHTRVGDHCFFGPAAVVAGDAEIGELCFVGTNATVRDRVRIGARCVIGAGAVIMSDCADGGVYPAARTGRRD